MTTTHEVEARLLQTWAFELSLDAVRWLDQRVGQIPVRSAVSRGGVRSNGLLVRLLVVIAAFVLLTGAVAAALGLLDRLVESSGQPGWRVAWDDAERLDLTATDKGVTITLERAYADVNQVLVGFTVAGLEAPTSTTGERPSLQWKAEIQDPSGRSAEQWAPASTGMLMAETGLSAVIETWDGAVAPAAGTWVLTFTSVGYYGAGLVSGECYAGSTLPECVNPPPNAMVDGTWRFAFQLPQARGVVVATDAALTVGDGTLTLTDLRISPTMIDASLVLRVAGASVVQWGWQGGTVEHDGTTRAFQGSRRGPAGDVNELMTVAGSADASGTWTLAFDEITYRTADGEGARISGPWRLALSVR